MGTGQTQAQRLKELVGLEIINNNFLLENGIDCAFLATKENMKTKQTIDATAPIRKYFTSHGFHDFESQQKGPEHKVTKPAFIITPSNKYSTEINLYRSVAPGKIHRRISVPQLWEDNGTNDILALLVYNDQLNIINTSKYNLEEVYNSSTDSILKKFLSEILGKEKQTLIDLSGSKQNTETSFFNSDDKKEISLDDQKAIEGIAKEMKVMARSRNKKNADACKKRDDYACQACNFTFKNKIVECHHLNPLSETNEKIISLEELITLCPTCHRIAHYLLKIDTNKYKLSRNLIPAIREALSS